jgi:hypothetical protein
MRISPNKARLAGEGFWNTNPPTGYDVARLMADGTLIPSEAATHEQRKASLGAVLVPNDVAPHVVEAFRMYAEGRATLAGVMDYLRASGLAITRQGVLRMLRNRAYIGLVVYGAQAKSQFNTSQVIEVRGRHEPLIDEETFNRVQERLGYNRRLTRAAVRGKHLLSGLVSCGLCGSRMKASVANGYVSYACRSRKGEVSTQRPCTMRYISGRKLDAQVKAKVLAALSPLGMDDAREGARERLRRDAAKRMEEGDRERKALERRKAELEEQLTSVEEKLITGLLGTERFLFHQERITKKLEEVKCQLDALPRASKVDMAGMFNILDGIEWENLSDEGWRHLLTTLTDGVTWKDGEVTIRWKPEWEAMLSVS